MHEIPLPYSRWLAVPSQRRATILGARTRTEIFRAQETVPGDGAVSNGARFEFPRNGVVTGISTRSSLARPNTFDLLLQVLKDGHEFLFTDGIEAQRVAMCSLAGCFDPWLKCWIPVDSGERWTFNLQNNLVQTIATYAFAVRVERFLEEPPDIPDAITQSLFYKVRADDLEPAAAQAVGGEFDFRRDGWITGLRAVCDTSVTQAALLSGVQIDLLIDGQIPFSMANQTISPIDAQELSPVVDPWFSVSHPVTQHRKWQFNFRNVGTEETSVEMLGRVEELRRPWMRWDKL